MKKFDYHWLSKILFVPGKKHELQKALTHKSFYSESDKNNSRYIFLGMYAFKGYVAKLFYTYVPGDGTQLQHLLGNVFKPQQLKKIYQRYYLSGMCRYDESFDGAKNFHLFVYGLLGFILMYMPEEKLNRFIILNFLYGNENYLPALPAGKDFLAQCNYFCRQLYGCNVQITFDKHTDNRYWVRVYARDELLAQHISISYRYARKKALKLALINLSRQAGTGYFVSEEYKKRESNRMINHKNCKADNVFSKK